MTKHQLISMLSSVDFICEEQVALQEVAASSLTFDFCHRISWRRVHTNEGVEWVESTTDTLITCGQRKQIPIRQITISAIHPCSLLRLMPENSFQSPIERGLTVFRIVILLSRFISS